MASIESLFWIPVFVFFLVLVLDASSIYYGKAQALRMIQDGNRALSVGVFDSTSENETFIADWLSQFSTGVTVKSEVDSSTGIISTSAKIPAKDLMSIGSIPMLEGATVLVTAQHFLEQ